jgi:glycerol-3-phosphate cytidylyltransferase
MVVYTVGTFDLLHVGHLALLEFCSTLGDTVAVGVASDEVVKLYKPNIPVIPLEQRIEMLLALSCVDIALPYHELDYINVCKKVKADIFVIGEDWGRKPHNQGIEDFLKGQSKEVVQIKYNPRNSSTRIKKDVLSLYETGKRI